MSNRFLTEIKLENFQDHADTCISLVNGINLIVGSSDAGKSAILRAINFVFHNNLKGDSFIRHGTDECKVTLKFSDGVEVTRIKGKDVNSYHLKDAENNNHSFPKVGTSIPEEIKKQLGNPPVDDKKRPISYADQMSNLFLVDLSPSDLPRTLSELTGIQNLQNAAEQLSKNARSFDRSIKDKNDSIQNTKTKLEQYSYVDKDLESFEKIEKKLEKIDAVIKKTNQARTFIQTNNKIAQEANVLKNKIALDIKLFTLNEDYNKLNLLFNSINSAKKTVKSYKVLAEEHNTLKSEISLLKNFKSQKNLDTLKEINDLIEASNKCSNYQKQINDLTTEQNKLNQSIDSEKTDIDSFKIELSRLVDELKVKGNWCKACNRPLI